MAGEPGPQGDALCELELQAVIGFNGHIPSGLICHPDREHFIYPLGCTIIIQGLNNNTQAFLHGHTNNVSCVAVSRSGCYVASGQVTFMGFKADIILWDYKKRELLARLSLHKGKIEKLAFSPNDLYLVSLGGQDDGSVVVWSIAKRDPICGSPASARSAGNATVLAFSNCRDEVFVSAGNGTIRVWELDLPNRKIRPTECQTGQLKRVITCIMMAEDDSYFYVGTSSGDILKLYMKSKLMSDYGPVKEKFSLGVGDLFRVRVAGGSVACSYLSPQDGRPLYHPAVDRALQFGGPGSPHHVKLVVEWDPNTKERLFGSIQEEVVQDTESVRLQQQAHQQQHSCTLDECFQLYTKEEQLAPDDAWRCPHCQVLQQGVVKLSLWTLPDILIIHLKRFRQVGERRTKLSTLIHFPLRSLNMAPHVAKRSQTGTQALGPWATWKQLPHLHESSQLDSLYDLYAVCNHHGSMQGGHYTAYCRNALDGRWYSYDDSTVEPVLEDEVSTRGAYILFYQRMNVIPSWSASSSMQGSTSSSMSDHWLARLSGSSKRESLVSRSSTACPSLPKAPDSPVFLDTATSQEKGGFESRPLVRGIQGRSVSMKVSPTKPKLGATKPVPLRWSFAARDRPQAASGELVEYLESGRRPRYTNESIVPLMTGGSENTPVPARPLLNPAATGKDQGTGGAGRASGNSQGAGGGAAESHGKAPPATEMAGTLKRSSKPKEEAGQPQRTSKKLELPINSGGPRSAEEPKSNGSKGSSNGAARAGTLPHPHRSLRARGAPGRDEDHDQRTPAKAGEHGRDRDPEAERQLEGKFTIFRAGFLKKEPKRPGESEPPHTSEPAMGSSRTSLSNGTLSVISEGRANGMLGRRGKEGQANGRISRSEVDIKRSQSSASIHSKADWVLRRSASLYKNGGGSHQHSHSVPLEKAAYGTLQRVKYHTASLGRKKPVPESSF
ncbi:unnamed protein product [Natator depressus]